MALGEETRAKLRISVQKQQESESEFPEQEAGFAVQGWCCDLPERVSCLRCFLGHGGKDWHPPAHLSDKPAAALGFAEL